MESTYTAYARRRDADGVFQQLEEHLLDTGKLASSFANNFGLADIGLLLGLLHDAGKYPAEWQAYLEQSVPGQFLSDKLDHATAGAQLLERYMGTAAGNNPVAQVLFQLTAMCCMYHHGSGLPDMLDLHGESPFSIRLNKDFEKTHINEIEQHFSPLIRRKIVDILSNEQFQKTFFTGVQKALYSGMDGRHFTNKKNERKENMFNAGLLCRMLSSCLIDADRCDSALFDNELDDGSRQKQLGVLADPPVPDWHTLLQRLERYLAGFAKEGTLNRIRSDISERCRDYGEKPDNIYFLSAATGAGKTLASLRFALTHAETYHCHHIFIIAPYTSILDQNAERIRSILEPESERGRVVLECHSNLTEEKKTSDYDRLSERWDAPVIITTMVQFLESLFGSGTRKIRRMHQLAHSVIIFDEIQTLPLSCTYLFNWSLPMLTGFCRSAALLCTATQPSFDRLPDPDFSLPVPKSNEIVADTARHFRELRRVDVIDKTRSDGGYSLEEIADFVREQFDQVQSLLIVTNTKPQASGLFNLLKEYVPEENIHHLSTNMCPAHRKAVIKTITDQVKNHEKCLCVSTKLIEAGVDLDFDCAIRFLAGLDSIAQTAGRCNRNGLLKNKSGQSVCGKTFIVNETNEKLGELEELKCAQRVMQNVLRTYHRDESEYDNSLLHPDLVKQYFTAFYVEQTGSSLSYEVDKRERGLNRSDTMLELLSTNEKSVSEFCRIHGNDVERPFFAQAFKTAWEQFEVIQKNTQGVLVPYEQGHDIIGKTAALDSGDYDGIRQLLREAQQFSINVYRNNLSRLVSDGILFARELIPGELVYMVADSYYDKKLGLTRNFSGSTVLAF